MRSQLIPALRATLLLLLLTSGFYPLAVTLFAQLCFSNAANGSLILAPDGTVVGSSLIGQSFVDPGYLQGRPAANSYDAANSGGSNFGLGSAELAQRRASEAARLRSENPDATKEIPETLLAASASGLDPDVPVEAARWQLPRIAKSRNMEVSRLESFLEEQVHGPDLGFLGEPRVNVLAFNLALDRRFPRP